MFELQFGEWQSPITSDYIVEKTTPMDYIHVNENYVYWIERRSKEKGRCTLIRRGKSGVEKELTSGPYNVRNTVHEYGGLSYLLAADRIYFSNFSDQCLYRIDDKITKITDGTKRYADGSYGKQGRLYFVAEEHFKDKETENTIVMIDESTLKETVVCSGYDFYAAPRVSPDGKKIAYLCWNHPDMPFDAAELWVADVEKNGSLINKVKVAGSKSETTNEPKWTSDNSLVYLCDKTGFANLYIYEGKKSKCLYKVDAEFGYPHWVFGLSTYVISDDGTIFVSFGKEGEFFFGSIKEGVFTKIDTPYCYISDLAIQENNLYFIGNSFDKSPVLVCYNIKVAEFKEIKKQREKDIAKEYISVPQSIKYESEGAIAYAYYYPPKNPNFTGIKGQKPPLIIKSHGGPTAQSFPMLSYSVQYWTSRGFAFLDVNYGGSTGFGRKYQERLKDKWGIIDVEDCVNGAMYLVKQGLVDKNKLIIRGGSAGGYTTLAALTFTDIFSAGASYYGVSDLEALVKDTHKFESRYLDNLIGPYPEKIDLYKEKSPIHHIEKLTCPVILLQGKEDKVVPKEQAEMMFEALKNKKIKTSYILFDHEQHGFRDAKNIKRALEAEIYFYGKVFGFIPSDKLKEIRIENE